MPYFHKLSRRILSKEFEQKVIDLTFQHLDAIVAYKAKQSGLEDGNNYLDKPQLESEPEIQALLGSCALRCYPLLMVHKPNVSVRKHVDDPVGRNCVLIHPIYPKENYSPTQFWRIKNATPTLFAKIKNSRLQDWDAAQLEQAAVCDFADGMPAFVNTQKIHSVSNNDTYRINFQLCFADSFERVVDRFVNGTLFNRDRSAGPTGTQ